MRPTSWTIERLDSVRSTNDHLKWAARRGAVDRTAVVARQQTGGRGRGNNTWSSPDGGLYCSLLLRDVPIPLQPLLGFVAGEALGRTIESFGLRMQHWLKWPNDLLVAPAGKDASAGKAGGILVEAVSQGAELEFAVVGIGVNLSTAPADLPTGQDPPAVALASYAEPLPDADLFLDVFLSRIDEVLRRFAAAPALLVTAVERRLAWKGDTVRVRTAAGGLIEGTLVGLAPTGGIRLRTGDDELVLESWDVGSLDHA